MMAIKYGIQYESMKYQMELTQSIICSVLQRFPEWKFWERGIHGIPMVHDENERSQLNSQSKFLIPILNFHSKFPIPTPDS